jgi:GTP-dependent dephospho-CoA kinase
LYTPNQVRSSRFGEDLRTSPLVITVGDRVTETAQELGRTPDVQVVDGFERRKRRTPPDIPYVRLLKASNPAGVITNAAESAVRSAIGGRKPARVLIEGEEDLLAIIAIDAAPIGSSVYYGQPGVGVVLVTVDERAKSSVGRILTSMRKEQDGLD